MRRALDRLYNAAAYLAALFTQREAKPPKIQNTPGTNSWIELRLLPTRTGWKPFSAAVQAALRKAQNHIYLENPYLFDKRTILALVRARLRGVDVRVVLPTSGDSGFMNSANLVAANVFVRNGVRVYAYRGMTHVKAAIYDGWSCVGSANFATGSPASARRRSPPRPGGLPARPWRRTSPPRGRRAR